MGKCIKLSQLSGDFSAIWLLACDVSKLSPSKKVCPNFAAIYYSHLYGPKIAILVKPSRICKRHCCLTSFAVLAFCYFFKCTSLNLIWCIIKVRWSENYVNKLIVSSISWHKTAKTIHAYTNVLSAWNRFNERFMMMPKINIWSQGSLNCLPPSYCLQVYVIPSI